MSVKKSINSDIETVLVSNAPFEYAHLIKFERPNAPDSLKFRTNANRYAYFTDASRDISFDDGSSDHDGNANGSQIYRANRIKSVGSYSETILAKASTTTLTLGAEQINTSVSVTGTLATAGNFTYSSGFTTEVFDFVEQGFREGDLVSFTRNDGVSISDGTNTTASAKYVITGFSNSNQTIALARTGNDTASDFFDIGFPSGNLSTAFTIRLESEELRGVLAVSSADLSSPTFHNREVFIYKIFIDPETGDIQGAGDSDSINGILTFKGIITSCNLNEKTTGSTVSWSLTSHWGDFNEVKGRITADSAHRGLDASESPNPSQALRPLHAADLGFLHSETSLAALAEYQRIEIRQEHRSSRAGGLRGLFGGRNYSMVDVEEVIDEKVNLDLGLKAARLPLVYGVRKLPGIPIFADTDKDDPKKVFVIYALSEGEIHGVFNLHIDGTSIICTDEQDFTLRNATDGTQKEDSKMVCYGRMSQGDTLGGVGIATVNTSTGTTSYSNIAVPEAGSNPIMPVFTLSLFDLIRIFLGLSIGGSIITQTIESSDIDLTPDRLGGSFGLQNRQAINLKEIFGDDFNMSLSFMRGTSDQPAMDKLVSLANQNKFKRQSEFYGSNATSLPYWSPNHRLLDTAYVLVEYEINEEMTELPEFEYTIKGKVYENYNYDNTFTPISSVAPSIYEGDNVTYEVSYNNGNSYETVKKSDGTTSFKILDRYERKTHTGGTEYRLRPDATPFYRNDGSTLIAPNGKPTYDDIRIKKGNTTFNMKPWNAGVLTTETAFPSQKVDANSVGASSNKLTVTVGSLGNLSGIDEVQVVSQTAGNELSGDLKNLKFGTFDTTTSGTTLTLTNTNFSSAPSSGTSIALQPSRIFDLSSVSEVNAITSASDITGQFLEIIETGEKREITAFGTTSKKVTIASPFMFPPQSNNTFKITGSGRDLRAGNNPAMQLLDYLTNDIYGKGLDLDDDIDLSSFISSGKLCDTRSDVKVKLTSGTPVIGNRYIFNPNSFSNINVPFSGKAKSYDSSTKEVTFTEVSGKLLHEYNNFRVYEKGDVIYSADPNSGTPSFSTYISSTPGTVATDPADGQISGRTSLLTTVSGGSAVTLSDDSVTLTIDKSSLPEYEIYDSDFIKYWRYLGWEHHHQRWVTRHQTNFEIDTKSSVFSNVNTMLAHFNGILSYEKGKYELNVETQESAPASSNSFNGVNYNENVNPYYIEKSDIIGDIKLTDNSLKNAKNVIQAQIADPALNYNNRSVTFLNADYLKADRNVRKTMSVPYTGITNYYNGRINAERFLTETRFGKEVTLTVGQKGLLLKPGQIISLNYEPFNFTNKLFRIINLNFQANCTVSIKAIEYDDASYIISAQRKNKIYSEDTGVDVILKPPGSPTNLSISTTKPGYFAISWTNATNFVEASDSTEVFASSDNNRANAVLIATVDNTTNVEFLIGDFGNRFFWIRHKRIHQSKANTQKILRGAYVPTSATGGQSGTAKLMNPSFGFDVGSAFIKFNAAGSLDPSGAGQDTTFNVAKRGLTGTPTIQLLDADQTARSGNSAFTDGSQSISGNSATLDASTFVSTDTPKIIKATLTEGGETFTAIASVGIIKTGADGSAGIRTTTGFIYFNAGSASAPAGPDADNNATFTFGTGAFTGLDTGWQTTPPTANPTDSNPKFWVATFTAVENSAGVGTSSGSNLTFGSATEFINFTEVVAFTDLSSDTSTVIHGGNITTGNIQSANFSSSGGSFSTAGTEIRLADGQITAPQFSIDSTGNAAFKGNLTGSSGTFAGTLQVGGTTLTSTNTLNTNTTKSDVGLSNVNNPASAVTPISSSDVNDNVTSISGGVITTGTLSANRIDLDGTSLTADSNGLKVGGIDITAHANVGTLGATLSDQGVHTLTNSTIMSIEKLTTPLTLTIPATRTVASRAFIIRLMANPVGFQAAASSIFLQCGFATTSNITAHNSSPFFSSGTLDSTYANNYLQNIFAESVSLSHKFTVTTSTSSTTTVYIYGFGGIGGFLSPKIQYTLTCEGTFR